jgi:hypothetical protein
MSARTARIFIPVGRPHLEALRDTPQLLSLYVLLSDRCDKARFQQSNHDDTIFYRGCVFQRIEAHTYICNLHDLAAELHLPWQELMKRLQALYGLGCLECLVFVTGSQEPEDPDLGLHDVPENLTSYGVPLNEFVEGGVAYSGYEDDEWIPNCFIRVTRDRVNGKGEVKRVPFIQVPAAVSALSDKQLRFLLYIYSRAVFTRKERIYLSQSYFLQPGELVASYREVGRALEEHDVQIRRWAQSAERLSLLRKIPTGRTDALWKIALPSRPPKEEK